MKSVNSDEKNRGLMFDALDSFLKKYSEPARPKLVLELLDAKSDLQWSLCTKQVIADARYFLEVVGHEKGKPQSRDLQPEAATTLQAAEFYETTMENVQAHKLHSIPSPI
jgi:hypothetical protein